ncbi:MAG: hypothetical protein ACHQ52_07310, partial [Candidatus Eisenbacteria bacterium]
MSMARSLMIALALAGAVAGCSRDTNPTRLTDTSSLTADATARLTPDAHGHGMFIDRQPLALGDRWKYNKQDRMFTVDASGDTTILFDSHGTV